MRNRAVSAVLVVLVFVSAGSLQGQTKLPASAAAAMRSIDAERIRAHVRFLADDSLEGRGTGQRGGDAAAMYIATELALNGLKPAGDNGTYLQKVPMVGITTLPDTTFAIASPRGDARNLKWADEYVATDQTQKAKSDVDAEIVFVGYGIEAPEYNWDDYKGVDVKGKVLLMLVNQPTDDPKIFKGTTLTYYGRWTYKFEEAARKGAVGVLLVHKTDMASYGWEVVRSSNSGEKSYLQLDGTPKLKVASWIQLSVAKDLAAAAGKDLDTLMKDARSRDFHPVGLGVKLNAHMVSKIRPFESNNVIGMLPGSNAVLKKEAVLYTAHYDHFGIRPDLPGDNIYNGAADNATGCGVVLELAHVFSQATQKPSRSILFSLVTAEEQGLLGSEYLGKHPPIPAKQIVLDLNFDNLTPLGTPEEVEVTGAERTTFYPVVQATAKEFGLAIRPDSRPEAGHYYRSDHFSLARVGIPSFSVNQGVKFKGHDAAWGLKQYDDYTSQRYHQPNDEYHPEMDFAGDALMARFGFALGWSAATSQKVIAWEKGDEFEAARLK